jgi:DNA-directed RNA polymerase subunit M/transcription elongation factor TFIIS
MDKDETKEQVIDTFLKSLGDVQGAGFTATCNKCGSNKVIYYDDTGMGSEWTGAWGDAGIKCTECGNAHELVSY